MDNNSIKIKDIYYHSLVAQSYDSHITRIFNIYHRHFLHPYIRNTMNSIEYIPKTLDIGTGTGEVAFALASVDMEVFGLDHSKEMIDIANKKLIDNPKYHNKIHFLKGDSECLPFPENSFDIVTCQGLLHHLPKCFLTIKEITRVLKPWGNLYISEPCINTGIMEFNLKIVSSVFRTIKNIILKLQSKEYNINTDEKPIVSEDVINYLHSIGYKTKERYVFHVPHMEKLTNDNLRLKLILLLSKLCKKGNIVFIEAVKK